MLTSILYAIFLEPLETLYRLAFDICQRVPGHNLLVALLLLSLISSLLLSAVERKAAKYVNQEKLIQSVLSKQLKTIKENFSGLERQGKIKRLYQRYSYNPLYSARASLGVLAQLPFLLGAYLMLLHDEELVGVSVPGISDLSQPDGLLFGLNLLPCLMLAVNAVNSGLSTWLTRKEKLTALTIGAVFFVLLYAAPSCMLIYWTTNNVIQLLKTLHKRFLKGGTNKLHGVWQSLGKIASQAVFSQATVSGEHTISIRHAVTSLLSLVGLTAIWLIARHGAVVSNYCSLDETHAQDLNCINSIPRRIYELSLFPTVFSCLLGVALLTVLYTVLKPTLTALKTRGIKNCGICAGLSAVTGVASAVFILCSSLKMYQTPGITAIGLTLLTLITACLPVRGKLLHALMPDANVLNKSKALFMPAALIITGLAIVYAPTMLFLSDPRAFGLSFWDLITDNLKFLWFLWFTLAFGYYIATGRIRVIAAYIMVAAAVIAIIYEFVLVLKLGTLQAFTFTDITFIVHDELSRDRDYAVILLIAIVVFLCYRLRMLRVLSTLLYVFCAFVYIYPITAYLPQSDSVDEISARIEAKQNSPVTDQVPENVKDFFKFSDRDNIVVFMLDAFTGGNMREILAAHPELRQDLEGFVWYEDTMTAGQPTDRGIQSIIGGTTIDPVRMQHDNGMPIAERINKGWSEFLNYLSDKGYQVNVHEPMWLQPKLISKYLNSTALDPKYLYGNAWFEGFWDKRSQLKFYSKISGVAIRDRDDYAYLRKFSRIYGLYSILPNSKKYKVYRYGSWGGSIDKAEYMRNEKIIEFSNSEVLPYIASAESISPQYKFIHLATTHYPFNMDEKCNIDLNKSFNDINPDGTIVGHLNVEYCQLKSLGKFFKWMKEQGIYDNSQIIIVSDHGNQYITPAMDDSRATATGIALNNPEYFVSKNASYALLLIKERSAKKEFSVNSEYITSNADVPLFIKHALGDELMNEPYLNQDRVRINVQSGGGASTPYNEHCSAAFVVRGSMFDKSHWTEIIDQKEVQELWKLLYDHE